MNNNIIFDKYSGNNGNYNLIKINEEDFNKNFASIFKGELSSYFENCNDKKLNSCLDLRKVSSIDSSGLAALLVFRRLCILAGQDNPYLVIRENESIERFLNISQTDTIFNVIYEFDKL